MANSAAQLRREAAKARTFAGRSSSDNERIRLEEVAASLDREAMAIEIAHSTRFLGNGGPQRSGPAVSFVLPHPEA